MPDGELGAEARQLGVGAAGSTAAAVQARLLTHFILYNFSADKKFSISQDLFAADIAGNLSTVV